MLSLASASLSFAGLAPRASPSTVKMVAVKSKPEFAYGAPPPAHALRAPSAWPART